MCTKENSCADVRKIQKYRESGTWDSGQKFREAEARFRTSFVEYNSWFRVFEAFRNSVAKDNNKKQ